MTSTLITFDVIYQNALIIFGVVYQYVTNNSRIQRLPFPGDRSNLAVLC